MKTCLKEINFLGKDSSVYFSNDVFEQPFLPRICGMRHHCEDGVVVLLVFIVKENQLGP